MKRFYFILIFSFLFIGLSVNAQDTTEFSSVQLLRAQNNFNTSRNRTQNLIQQLNSTDSTYKSGNELYRNSLKDYRKSKSAFKSLVANYKKQTAPYRSQLNSKDREKSTEARAMLKTIKDRYQDNGNAAADRANMASSEMVKAAKIMKRAKIKRRLILSRLNKSMEQVNKWGLILYEMGLDSVATPKKTVY